jgi:hypothetical protein
MPKLIQIREEVTACRECVHRQTRWEGMLQYSRCTKVKKRLAQGAKWRAKEQA